jgi:hypothetical protein
MLVKPRLRKRRITAAVAGTTSPGLTHVKRYLGIGATVTTRGRVEALNTRGPRLGQVHMAEWLEE